MFVELRHHEPRHYELGHPLSQPELPQGFVNEATSSVAPQPCVNCPGHQESFFLESACLPHAQVPVSSLAGPQVLGTACVNTGWPSVRGLCRVCQPRGPSHQGSGCVALRQLKSRLVLPF